MTRLFEHPWKIAAIGFCALILLFSAGYSEEHRNFREDAQLEIFVAGKAIGKEKFSVQGSGDSVRSSSSLSFKEPGAKSQTVKIETELKMDGRFVPASYTRLTEVNGQRGMVRGLFSPGQANFEFVAAGRSSRKSGLLVGDRYIVLDTNVFHHFTLVVRLFDFAKESPQSIEVVIPQEEQNGLLKLSDAGLEKVSIRGKNRELHHLKADSGSVQIDLWVDDQHTLYMIALPSKRIEVVRS